MRCRKKKMNSKYKPKKLFIKRYSYNDLNETVELSDEEKSSDIEEFVDSSDMSPLEGEREEVNEG